MDVTTFHLLLGRSVAFFTFICGVWGVLAHFGRLPNDSRYYSTLVIAEVVLILQALLGVILIVMGRLPPDLLHFAYGGLAAMVLPVAYNYASQRGWSTALVCGLAALFIWGLSIRAFTTSIVGIAGLVGATGR